MKAITVFLLSAIAFAASAETGTVFNIKDSSIIKALKVLNDYRVRTGLKPVKLSAELSKGCYNHARYTVKNSGKPAVQGISPHYEVDSLPYATPDGKKAGMSSCMGYLDPVGSVHQFMNTFYHRMPLIQPNVTEVGIGYYTEDYRTVCCVDMRNAYKWNNDTTTAVVVFPEDQGFDIPVYFQSEHPNPIPDSIYSAGFPITIQFFKQSGVKNVKVKLTDNKGNIVNCLLSTPENPLTDFPQWNTVCIIPTEPLGATRTYTVDFSCTLNNKPYKKTWRFYTVLVLGEG